MCWQWLLIPLQANLLWSHILSHSSLQLTHSFFFLMPSHPLFLISNTFADLLVYSLKEVPSLRTSWSQHHSHGLCFCRGNSSFILSKAFVVGWKLADAEAIQPKLLDQYKHPSLSPGPFWPSQCTVHYTMLYLCAPLERMN